MNYPRLLTNAEKDLVSWMIIHGDAPSDRYLAELEKAQVIEGCKCGCASIDFQIDGITPDKEAKMDIISDWMYGDPKGDLFGAYIFTLGGILAGLDLHTYAGPPAPLPSPNDLKPLEENIPNKLVQPTSLRAAPDE